MKHRRKGITYTLMKSKRKTMSIYVEPNGKVTVRAPKYVTLDKINRIMDLKSNWIYKSLAELKEVNGSKIKRSLVNGEGFLFVGRSYRLKIGKDLEKPLSLSHGFFMLDEKHIQKARQHFIQFYREMGDEHIPQRVNYFKRKLGVNPEKIRIMELRNRWASIGKKSLNFHWKVMLAPMTVIDYIIVHELAHLVRRDHSPIFWETVESIMPNYEEKKNWLRIHGANLDI